MHAPLFPKAKDEGWWLVLGEVDTNDLVALKRVGPLRGGSKTVSLAFSPPEHACRAVYTLYLISDCYLGLDQQCDLCFNFITS